MPRPSSRTLPLALVAWAGSVVAVVPPLRGAFVPRVLPAVAAIAAIAGGLLALGLATGRVAPLERERRGQAALVGLPLALVLVAWSGGLDSPAVLLVALCVLAYAWRRPTGAAATYTVAAVALLGAVSSLGAPLPWTRCIVPLALLGAVGLLPAWFRERGSATVAEARQQTERLGRFFTGPRTTPAAVSSRPSALRHDVMQDRQLAEDARQFDFVAAWLADVRDQHGASEVVFWRLSARRDALSAATWTGARGTPPTLRPELAAMVEWAAREARVQLDAAEGAATFAAVPVTVGASVVGAMTLAAPGGMRHDREHLREWLPRHAAQLARLVELLDTGWETGREHVQANALLAAVQRFQAHRTTDDLGRAICETALQVTSGTRAVLVRWDAVQQVGIIAAAVGPGAVTAAVPVAAGSLVARACGNGMPQVWEEARFALAGESVFGPGEPAREVGSLGIWLLKAREGLDVLGAIVIEGERPRSVLIKDVRNVRLLAGYAVLALETVWEIDEVTTRARTDQLTGLSNRRYFDEQLERVRHEHLRRGHTCSLIVADVDHFKTVNDTYGHDAGDAVLKAIATLFREGVRQVDVCARYGGEEIAILLPETGPHEAADAAERLRRVIEAKVIRHGAREIPVTASFGVASFPECAARWDGFFAAADKALYQAKRDGRNQVRVAPAIVTGKST